jgi:DMSO/TMAO reductase YedYZ molybdopterin-dependent catalytic subunit
MPLRTLFLTGGMCAAIVLVMLALASAPRPAPAAAPERAHKADRLPARPLEEPPPPEPQPLPKAAPAPALAVLEAVRAAPAASNICTRHHGWKVITDNGRSWHCAYAR